MAGITKKGKLMNQKLIDMKRRSIKSKNNVCKGIVIALAAALAVGAVLNNPAHLFTAAVVFAFGLEVEPFNEEDYDII